MCSSVSRRCSVQLGDPWSIHERSSEDGSGWNNAMEECTWLVLSLFASHDRQQPFLGKSMLRHAFLHGRAEFLSALITRPYKLLSLPSCLPRDTIPRFSLPPMPAERSRGSRRTGADGETHHLSLTSSPPHIQKKK
jgi:hypothetical protein